MRRGRVLQFGLMTGVLASGYGVMFTVLDDFRDRYDIAAHWLGLIVGVGFFSAVIAQLVLAPYADRGHARALVLAGIALNAVGLLALGSGTVVVVLLGGRLVSGLGIGMTVPAIRRIVINADPDDLGTNVGLLIACDVTGFAAGPALAAVLVPWFGLASPFVVIAAVSVLLVPILFRLDIVEAGRVRGAEGVAADIVPARRFAFDLLRSRLLVAGLMLGAAMFMMIGTFDALWAIVLDDIGASDVIANIGITVFALPLIVLGSTGGRLAQRFGPFRLGPLGLVIGAGFMFLYGQMPTGGSMLAIGMVHAVADGLTVACAGVAVAMAAPPDRQAGAQGMLGAVQAGTAGATAVLAGVLYSAGGRVLAYTVCAVVMVALAAGAYALSVRSAASSDRRTLPASSRT